MFRQISWSVYFTSFIAVAVLYYLVATLILYKKNIRHLAKRYNSKSTNRHEKHKALSTVDIEAIQSDFSAYQALNDEITAFIESEDANNNKLFKSDLLFSLVAIIQKYPQLKDTTYSEIINKTIRSVYLRSNTDTVTEEELAALWQA